MLLMGTKARIWYAGAFYHITARGNHRNDIFRDNEDFQVFLIIIEEALKYYNNAYEIICYCLMTNHIHLLVKTGDKHICHFIQRVNAIYARNFNSKYNYIGHLFQDRYFAELIIDDTQMLSASQYIHLNPVRANMVKVPEDYEWSSYAMYIGCKRQKLISSNKILSYFNGNNRKLYKEYVEGAIKYYRDPVASSEEI